MRCWRRNDWTWRVRRLLMSAMNEILAKKIVAVVRLDYYSRAVDVARALAAGGVNILEFTLTGQGAIEAVTATRKALGEAVCVGVGTVLRSEDAIAAIDAGAQMVKVFPARLGGPKFIKDILAPLPFLKLVPTGGVSPENAREFLDAGAVAVGIGGNLVSNKLVSAGAFDQ